jgi:hypothetical protein
VCFSTRRFFHFYSSNFQTIFFKAFLLSLFFLQALHALAFNSFKVKTRPKKQAYLTKVVSSIPKTSTTAFHFCLLPFLNQILHLKLNQLSPFTPSLLKQLFDLSLVALLDRIAKLRQFLNNLIDPSRRIKRVRRKYIRPNIRRPRRHPRRIDKPFTGKLHLFIVARIDQSRRRNMRNMTNRPERPIVHCRRHQANNAPHLRPHLLKHRDRIGIRFRRMRNYALSPGQKIIPSILNPPLFRPGYRVRPNIPNILTKQLARPLMRTTLRRPNISNNTPILKTRRNLSHNPFKRTNRARKYHNIRIRNALAKIVSNLISNRHFSGFLSGTLPVAVTNNLNTLQRA